MAISVTHTFVSPVADDGDPNEVGPNEWNAAHTISGLGTAAEADSTDFATAAQGAKADTAVQPAAIANMLETSDIGVSVQAHSAVLDATTASFLTTQETKLGHISVTQAVDLDAIETRVNALDAAVVLRGSWDASAGTFPGGGTARAGDSYIVSVAGTVDSVAFVLNDRIIAIADNASTTTFAANWFKADYTDQVLSVAGKTGAVTLVAADLTDVTASAAELNYVDGVTSAIQTQLDAKIANSLLTTRGDIIRRGASGPERVALGTAGYALKSDGTDPVWSPSIEVLTGNRTYYVRTDGSDSNTGLVNNAGGAFLTPQKAINAYLALDLNGYAVTIQIVDGTYTGTSLAYGNPRGATNAAPLTIQGNSGDTDAVIISTTSANGLYLAGIRANLKWFKVQTTTGGDCIIATDGAALTLTGLVFGATASSHVYCTNNSRVTFDASYEITGGGVSHFHSTGKGTITLTTGTITLTGTPTFSSYYMGIASGGSVEFVNGVAFSGTFTGKRFLIHDNGSLFTAGQNLNWIPGTIEGDFYGGASVTDNEGEKDYQVIPDAGNALSNVNTFQAFFPAASDVFAMQLNTTYRVSGWFTFVRTAGTTSHNTTFQWGGTLGTGGTAWWKFDFSNPNSGAAGAVNRRHATGLTDVLLASANTSATEEITVSFEGIVRSGSTTALLQPGFIYSAAPGGAPTVKAGEMRLQAVGTNAFAKNGAWS